MNKCLIPLRIFVTSFRAAARIIWLFILRSIDLFLLLHPPTSQKYRKVMMDWLKGGTEDPGVFMNNLFCWQTVVYYFKMDLLHAYHGIIKIGDLVDADSKIHMIKDGCITRTCSLLDLVKPGRLLLLNLGSTT